MNLGFLLGSAHAPFTATAHYSLINSILLLIFSLYLSPDFVIILFYMLAALLARKMEAAANDVEEARINCRNS